MDQNNPKFTETYGNLRNTKKERKAFIYKGFRHFLGDERAGSRTPDNLIKSQ